MSRRNFIATATILATAALPSIASAMSWSAQPLTVHEWGVQVFDWSAPTPARPDLPPFIHTDKTPGMPVPAPTKRVKDLPPDSGIRFKPVLYFYPPQQNLGENIVGVEMRFAYGHASAWYPQVNTFRTPDMTRDAKEPDWDAWRKATAPRMFTGNQQKPPPLPIPDDRRMELVWSRLTLSKDMPPDARLPDAPADSWTHTARQANSAYVSNGTEAEKFLFYEGATHESPAFAIVPDDDFMAMGNGLHVVNVLEMPIFNVFAIYRRDHHVWVRYAPSLDPIKIPPRSQGGAGATVTSIDLPDFDKLADWTDDKSLGALTTDRLLAAMTEGSATSINHGLRDPADPQGPTQSWQLFPDEAKALEKIWHDDFFNNEGLTILYRESPAALDKAMPLNLYTDMFHYIKLSRLGLVENKNIDVADARGILFSASSYGSTNPADRTKMLPLLQKNRLLTQNAVQYCLRIGRDPKDFALLESDLAKP